MKYMQHRNLKEITIGEWIDLEYYMRNEKLCEIANIVYDQKQIDFHQQPYRIVNEAVDFYISWRKEIYEKFPILFVQQETNEEKKRMYEKLGLKYDEEEDDIDKRNSEYNKVFGWFDILYVEICNSDFLKMREAYKLNIIEVFNFLTRNRLKH